MVVPPKTSRLSAGELERGLTSEKYEKELVYWEKLMNEITHK